VGKFSTYIAQTLQDKHEITMVSIKKVKRKFLEKSYKVKLDRVKLKVIKEGLFGKNKIYKKILNFINRMGNKGSLSTIFKDIILNLIFFKGYLNTISEYSRYFDFFINSNMTRGIYPHAKRNVMLCHFPTNFTWNTFTYYNSLYIKAYTFLLYLLNPPTGFFNRYEIFCNSKFTEKWTKNLWNVKPKGVLYPPVDFFQKKENKENFIIYVGRFDPYGIKRQHDAIRAFKKLYDTGLKDWKLHLIGGTVEEANQDAYLNYLKSLAKGYPIIFHENAKFTELGEFYSKAKIYWNLRGLYFKEDEAQAWLYEHFGITNIEAMQNYCVPIVFNGGGQVEVIENGKDGFLINSLKQLIKITRELVENNSRREDIAEKAYEKSKKFSIQNFSESILKIFK
ncbi:MAG: glycosyltransferase family 4 protein, partial [Candidatus Helarchaeota archaeon]|nr:glycosyltransferase family 4 protein [Candidatus Helarchaeota archaeon]